MKKKQEGDMTHSSCTVSIRTVKANITRFSFTIENHHHIMVIVNKDATYLITHGLYSRTTLSISSPSPPRI